MPVDLHYEHGRKANRWSKRKIMTTQIPTPDHMPDPELLASGAVKLPDGVEPPAAVPAKPTSPPPSAPPSAAPAQSVQPASAPMQLMVGTEELSHMIELKEAMVDRAQLFYQQSLATLQSEQSGLAALRAAKDRAKSGSVVFHLDA